MTSLQKLEPPLARLSVRLDSAGATNPDLKRALDYWQERRRGKVSPSKQDLLVMPADIAEIAFVALPLPGKRDWRLVRIGAKAFEILEPQEPQGLLTKLSNRPVAARLRRLLHLVHDAGEPVTALFDLSDDAGKTEAEILAAPLKSDDVAEAIFCSIVRRKRQ